MTNSCNGEESSSEATPGKPLTIGVFGGSFNPIHLGHSLLAITTQQTKAVDQVVLVPVFKHARKRDLLPFEDRVNMCKLAIAPFGEALSVSTVEQEVGESNGTMLRGLKKKYPAGTRFQWICGDDFFTWMERPKGIETLREVSGIIVQRRLHKAEVVDEQFFKEPIDEGRVRAFAAKMNLEIDFIYGELPHFSSTLVRRAPGKWRSFLSQSVAGYLDTKKHLLEQLIANLEADADKERVTGVTLSATNRVGAACIMRGLEVVHALQIERGRTALRLSTGDGELELHQAQEATDSILNQILCDNSETYKPDELDELIALDEELKYIPVWLERDRLVVAKRCKDLAKVDGGEGWTARYALVEKFNPRIDVLINGTIRALTEILDSSAKQFQGGSSNREIGELLRKWCQGKEALGRVRAFVCAGGPAAPLLVRSSLEIRERLNRVIDAKERSLARVLSLQAEMPSKLSAPAALHNMLDAVTVCEWSLMGCFASSTPLSLVHKLLEANSTSYGPGAAAEFDVQKFFDASSAALDFLLTFAKALAAYASANAC